MIPSGGTATELTGAKLIIAAILLFIYGALNNIGIGSYALTMATVYALGLNPAVSFPIMMGACTFPFPLEVCSLLDLVNTAVKLHYLRRPSVLSGY